MLHGYGLDHRSLSGCMEPIFRRIAGFQRVYIDLPAMGRSPAAGIKSSRDILDRVLRCIAAVAAKKKFILVGYSYGGYLAQHIALRKPDAIDGMLLLAPVVFAKASQRTLPRHRVFVKKYSLGRLKDENEVDIFNNLVIQTPAVWKTVKKNILSGYLLRKQSALERIQKRAYSIPGNIIKLKRRIAAPVVIIAGKQDSTVGFADAKRILVNYPNGKYVAINRAGHNLQFERPAAFRAIVEKWIRQVQQHALV